jgi:solute:Na+ symporter, SSS family
LQLTALDGLIVAAYFALMLAVGLYYRRRASRSVDEFFVSGRNIPWWLAGTSMVATTFAADTPLAVTGMVAAGGIAGNWLWWNFMAGGVLVVFFYARLWRRAGVLTDVEFAEIRYAGRPAAFLRGFRAVYLALPINCIVIGWVNLAMVKILTLTLGVSKEQALAMVLGLIALTSLLSTLSGLWGVIMTDAIQFVIMIAMAIVLAVAAVSAVGGMEALKQKVALLDQARGAAEGSGASLLDFFPALDSPWMPAITFLVYISLNWWASWYPGAEPGGGGYVAQRMFSARDERHALFATLWFQIAHYTLRPWPWILTALCAMVLYPGLADPETGYVQMMIDHMPAALRGVMLAAFVAAYMSTVSTMLNWGASYIVNDCYRRFLHPEATQKHYVYVSQATTVLLTVASAVLTFYMDSITGAWKLLIVTGAGTGGVLLARWYWWRVNAWSEVSAMVAAAVVSLTLQVRYGLDSADPRGFAYIMLITVGITTAVWLAVTFLTRPEPEAKLVAFYRRVHPSPAGWRPVARLAPEVTPSGDAGRNFADTIAGLAMIYSILFGTGKLLLGETLAGLGLWALAIAAGWWIWRDLARIKPETESAEPL